MNCPHCKKHINYFKDIVEPEFIKRYNSKNDYSDEELQEMMNGLYKSVFGQQEIVINPIFHSEITKKIISNI